MPPTPAACGAVRPPAVVNEAIRALLARTQGQLQGEDRAVYERLLEEWTAAVRAEVMTAA